MMTESTVCKPNHRRLVLLALACFAIGMIPVFSAAQTPAAVPNHDIVGTWQGTLHVAAGDNHPAIELRIVNKVAKGDDGKLKVSFYSIDQGGGEMKSSSASFEDGIFKYGIQAIDGSYEGKMSADGKSIAGN